jgi:hypothetical protein
MFLCDYNIMTRSNKKTHRKWSMKYKKVLIVIDQKDFLKNNIVNMAEKLIKVKNKIKV